MKPRTKMQAECFRLSQRLDLLSIKQREWSLEKVLPHMAYCTKKKVACLDCGTIHENTFGNRKKAKCAHCGRTLTLFATRKLKSKVIMYFMLADLVDDYMVFRYFMIRADYRVGWKREVEIDEVLQHWCIDGKNRVVIAKQHNCTRWYWYDSWSGNLEVRDKTNPKYDVYHDAISPDSRFHPLMEKYGIDHNFVGMTILDAWHLIQRKPIVETLVKLKRYDLVNKYGHHESDFRRFWSSLKITFRHKYFIDDIGMWFDYLTLLVHFRKDIHSPKYICPKNLKKEHDRLVAKKRDIDRKNELEAKKKRAAQNQKMYEHTHGKYFGMEWNGKSGMYARVLSSIEDFIIEGDELNHCVFQNEYFKRENSLIISVQIKGVRTETVEIDLKKLEVIQCRGKNNQNSVRHDEILQFVESTILQQLSKFKTENRIAA